MGEFARLLADHGPAFGQALLLTWKLTAISFVAGFALGVVVTVLRLLPLAPLRVVLTGYVEVFRNIPSVALLIFIVFALPDLGVLIAEHYNYPELRSTDVHIGFNGSARENTFAEVPSIS